ncbi:hypothetical protein A5866_001734 [Enterococcus sp. 12C11_DIV0727]|uniref:Transposase n=1 Tax=Candidatus Enterococcus lemimoniae TaxID=1834167 RepID=A0ABZ2T5I8_9ENTE
MIKLLRKRTYGQKRTLDGLVDVLTTILSCL